MIPYVMDDTQSLATIVADASNGLGRLAECINLEITESLDGVYDGSMVIPREAYNSGLVHSGGIIKAKANGSDDPQLFRVVKFKETLSSGLIECELEHISYDLNKTVMTYPIPVGGNTVGLIKDIFNDAHFVHVYPSGIFSATSNLPDNTTVRRWTFTPPPKTVRQTLLADNGLCQHEGWQMRWDNLNFEMRDRRGADKTDSVVITLGKNVLDFSNEEDIADIYDGVMGYVYVPSKWNEPVAGDVKAVTVGTTPQHILMVDLSENANSMDTPPSKQRVNDWTTAWLASNNPSIPKVSLDIDLISLENTGEYDRLKELEGLELGDTITVKINSLTLTATVTEVTYDALAERYIGIKLGNYQSSLANTIIGLVGENTAALSNTQQEYNSTFQSMKTALLFDTDQTNASSDWATERYNEYKISGNGFIIFMINTYTSNTESYGIVRASIQHSTDNGATWRYDAYNEYRHESGMANTYDGTSLTVPMAVSDEELVRCTWKITKETPKICKVKMLGIGVTATQTVTGGAI